MEIDDISNEDPVGFDRPTVAEGLIFLRATTSRISTVVALKMLLRRPRMRIVLPGREEEMHVRPGAHDHLIVAGSCMA